MPPISSQIDGSIGASEKILDTSELAESIINKLMAMSKILTANEVNTVTAANEVGLTDAVIFKLAIAFTIINACSTPSSNQSK